MKSSAAKTTAKVGLGIALSLFVAFSSYAGGNDNDDPEGKRKRLDENDPVKHLDTLRTNAVNKLEALRETAKELSKDSTATQEGIKLFTQMGDAISDTVAFRTELGSLEPQIPTKEQTVRDLFKNGKAGSGEYKDAVADLKTAKDRIAELNRLLADRRRSIKNLKSSIKAKGFEEDTKESLEEILKEINGLIEDNDKDLDAWTEELENIDAALALQTEALSLILDKVDDKFFSNYELEVLINQLRKKEDELIAAADDPKAIKKNHRDKRDAAEDRQDNDAELEIIYTDITNMGYPEAADELKAIAVKIGGKVILLGTPNPELDEIK